MNDKIEALAAQANAWFPTGCPSPEGGDEQWEDFVIFQKEDLQKFAGLMMQECIDWLYFHGESEAAERLEWRRANLGIK